MNTLKCKIIKLSYTSTGVEICIVSLLRAFFPFFLRRVVPEHRGYGTAWSEKWAREGQSGAWRRGSAVDEGKARLE